MTVGNADYKCTPQNFQVPVGLECMCTLSAPMIVLEFQRQLGFCLAWNSLVRVLVKPVHVLLSASSTLLLSRFCRSADDRLVLSLGFLRKKWS